MKNILITLLIVLSAAGVKAQLGAPKELTCTEEAFNFSLALGTRWKLSTPRMGPVGVIKDEPNYTAALALKVNSVSPKTAIDPSVDMPFNFEALQYANRQQNYPSLLANHYSFSVMDKTPYLLPVRSFNPAINYIVSKPNFPINSDPVMLLTPVQSPK